MKKVKALVAFSNGVIAMEQYEVRELPTDMANDLIAAGICVEISGGGSGGGVLVVTDTDGTLDKTWQEIFNAIKSNGAVLVYDNPEAAIVLSADSDSLASAYNVYGFDGAGEMISHRAASETDYPSM